MSKESYLTGVRIVLSVAFVTALGFAVVFLVEDRRDQAALRKRVLESEITAEQGVESRLGSGAVVDPWMIKGPKSKGTEAFVDWLLEKDRVTASLLLEARLSGFADEELEDGFFELMARDLEDRESLSLAGRILQEIATRDGEGAVSLLYALSPREKETLAYALAKGWTMEDADGALDWIENAWVDDRGEFVDRRLQNDLFRYAVDVLLVEKNDFSRSVLVLESVTDPDLKDELVQLIARRVVDDGPEVALQRLGEVDTALLDGPVMDAIAEEWAARDALGAADWVLQNEGEISQSGAEVVAKNLYLSGGMEGVGSYLSGLESEDLRDAATAEVARLGARRDPVAAARLLSGIEESSVKGEAVSKALREIGFGDFEGSLAFLETVYSDGGKGREGVLFDTLNRWVRVDSAAVEDYLAEGGSGLSDAQIADILMGGE